MNCHLLLCSLVIVITQFSSSALAAAEQGDYPENFFGDHPMLGIYMGGTTDDGGVIIRGIVPGTAAAEMGLQRGDVIRSINGKQTNGAISLWNEVSSSHVGDDVQVDVQRDGESLEFKSQYKKWPDDLRRHKPRSNGYRRRAGGHGNNGQGNPRHQARKTFLQRMVDAMRGANNKNAQNAGPESAATARNDHTPAITAALSPLPIGKALEAYRLLSGDTGFSFNFSVDVDSKRFAPIEKQGFAFGVKGAEVIVATEATETTETTVDSGEKISQQHGPEFSIHMDCDIDMENL